MKYILSDRAVLGVLGPDARQHLQGALTQDMQQVVENTPHLGAHHGIHYSAHLTPQGRLVCDCYILAIPGGFALDVHHSMLLLLAESLHKYTVGLQVEFHDLSADYCVLWDGQQREISPRAQGIPPDGTARFHVQRVAAGLPDGVLDNPAQKALPAELGLDALGAISFHKGCYVGQEVTARLHHRSAPKKRLYQCTYPPNTSSDMPIGTPILTISGSEVGWLGSSAHGHALAVIQTRVAHQPLYANTILLAEVRLPAYVTQQPVTTP